MTTHSRKLRSNIGNITAAVPVASNAAVLLVERLLKRVLEVSVKLLKDDEETAKRYFSNFFDTTMSTTERDQFVQAFINTPPTTVLGYPRVGAEVPCYAIVLSGEEESEAFLGDYAGSDDKFDYTGAFFTANYAVFVHSTHPDITGVLYQLAKAIIHANKALLMQAGIAGVTLSGGELAPDESYMPENWFSRVLRIQTTNPYTAPNFLPADPSKMKTFIYAHDIVVDGLQGGVQVKTTLDGNT